MVLGHDAQLGALAAATMTAEQEILAAGNVPQPVPPGIDAELPQVPNCRHDSWCIPFANAAGVFPEHHVKSLVKPIFHPPMSPHGVRETPRISQDRVHKKTSLHGFGLADQAAALDRADAA